MDFKKFLSIKDTLNLLTFDDEKAFEIKKNILNLFLSKGITVSMTFVICTLIFVSSLFSGFVSDDDIQNDLQFGLLGVDNIEDYTQIENWTPGQELQKEIAFKNNNTVPAIVRVSLMQMIMLFEIDTQTGNLFVRKSIKDDTIVDNNNWRIGNILKAYTYDKNTNDKQPIKDELGNDLYYVVKQVYIENLLNNYLNGKQGNISKYIHINWNDTVSILNTTKSSKWIYYDNTDDKIDNGYFYYLDVLKPGEQTIPLIDSLEIFVDAPNTWKNAIYKLITNVETIDASDESLKYVWGIMQESDIYKFLHDKLYF